MRPSAGWGVAPPPVTAVKTANGELITSSQGTTFSVIKSTNGAANGVADTWSFQP